MDEILASIRRIITDDDAPADEADAPSAATSTSAAVSEKADKNAEKIETALPATAPAIAEPQISGKKETSVVTPNEEAALVGDKAGADTASAFAKLSTAVKETAGESSMTMPAPGRNLEDVVREMLRPILKDWLDSNLPEIVREQVEEEVARISRGRSR